MGLYLALRVLLSVSLAHPFFTEGSSIAIPLAREKRVLQAESKSPYSYQNTQNLYASEYYGELSLGTPKKTFRLVFDTGSGNMIVPSSECNDEACLRHTQYDLSASSTAKPIVSSHDPLKVASRGGWRDTVTITFGTGEMSGFFARDAVCLGHICTTMNLVAATNATDEPFKDVPFDGILGLSLPQLAEAQEFCLIDALVRGGLLDRNLFSVFFAMDDDDMSSEIVFGEIHEDRMASPLTWVPVSNPGYWAVQLQDLALSDQMLGFCGASGCQMAVDTGTSLLTGPTRLINKLVDRIKLQSDCSNLDALPDLVFVVDSSFSLPLAPSDYVDEADGLCSLGLMALDVPPPRGPVFIVGDPFLRKYYTVYDRERLRVGFALARHGSIIA